MQLPHIPARRHTPDETSAVDFAALQSGCLILLTTQHSARLLRCSSDPTAALTPSVVRHTSLRAYTRFCKFNPWANDERMFPHSYISHVTDFNLANAELIFCLFIVLLASTIPLSCCCRGLQKLLLLVVWALQLLEMRPLHWVWSRCCSFGRLYTSAGVCAVLHTALRIHAARYNAVDLYRRYLSLYTAVGVCAYVLSFTLLLGWMLPLFSCRYTAPGVCAVLCTAVRVDAARYNAFFLTMVCIEALNI